jgi:hypothetical protein
MVCQTGLAQPLGFQAESVVRMTHLIYVYHGELAFEGAGSKNSAAEKNFSAAGISSSAAEKNFLRQKI